MPILNETTGSNSSGSKVLENYHDNNNRGLLQPMSQSSTIMISNNNVSNDFFNRSISGGDGNSNNNLEGAIGNHFLSTTVNTSVNTIINKNVFINTNINNWLISKQSHKPLVEAYNCSNKFIQHHNSTSNSIIDNNCQYKNNFNSRFSEPVQNRAPVYTIETLYSTEENITSELLVQNAKYQQLHHHHYRHYHQHHRIHNAGKHTMSPPINGSDLLAVASMASMAQAQVTKLPGIAAGKQKKCTMPFNLTAEERALVALLGIECQPHSFTTNNIDENSTEYKKGYLTPDIIQDNTINTTLFTVKENHNLILATKNNLVIDTINQEDSGEENMYCHYQWKYRGNHVTNGNNVNNRIPMHYNHYLGALNLVRPLALVWKKPSSTNSLLPIDDQRSTSPKLLDDQLLDIEMDNMLLKTVQFIPCFHSWECFTFTENIISDMFN